MAITRENLYKKFGSLLIESLALVIKDEINLLRSEYGLSERTNQQIMNAIEAKLQTLSKYDWTNSDG